MLCVLGSQKFSEAKLQNVLERAADYESLNVNLRLVLLTQGSK